ncbi:WD domain [Trypanosoma vivax]|uniref:Activated protein kinase C receptor homolog n=1 Tax=Trypanosoma vivax (strain Y486) TaxID=1055687 RepID=G0UD43_TRYVY|nr:WD domain [Trypanosoma vivax]CCC53753.1 putative activated protein kinase C receptor [Trypanosoma vivax Y486]KAH8608938.1 WD domain [Trypanosoma vivax]KAH8608969.1 WD domain [Trypanosoma vivax]KAH8609045.1 WD domain [Trypanosoma vivax]
MAVVYEGQLKGHRGWVTSLVCPQCEQTGINVVSASRDKTLISWSDNPNRHAEENDYCIPERRLEGHSAFVSDVALSNNGSFAVSASWDRSMRLWNLQNGQCQYKFLGHTRDVLSVAFSPDNRQIVSGSRDRTLRVWNVKGECMHTLNGAHSDWVSCVRFSPATDKPLIVSGGWDNLVKVWDPAGGRVVSELKGHTNYVTSVTVSPDGSLCASSDRDGVARLWDLAKGDSLFEMSAGAPINQICFSPNRYWMCAATDECIRIFDLENKDVIVELTPEAHGSKPPQCQSIAWSADGSTLYSGHADNVIRIWTVSLKA